jgi:hypothetical protein
VKASQESKIINLVFCQFVRENKLRKPGRDWKGRGQTPKSRVAVPETSDLNSEPDLWRCDDGRMAVLTVRPARIRARQKFRWIRVQGLNEHKKTIIATYQA